MGTHFGQEHQSIFGANKNFFIFLIKRFLSGGILRRGNFTNFKELGHVIYLRKKIRNRSNDFYTIFIEANPKIVLEKKSIYKKANEFFNLALIDDTNPSLSLIKLYLGKGGNLSQGSSTISENDQVDVDKFITTIGASASNFFGKLKSHIENMHDDYKILLRLNCEGVEDDLIYSAFKIFGTKIELICGSLYDVERIKGVDFLNNVEQFLKQNNLPFVLFSPSMTTWPNAYNAINKLLDREI